MSFFYKGIQTNFIKPSNVFFRLSKLLNINVKQQTSFLGANLPMRKVDFSLIQEVNTCLSVSKKTPPIVFKKLFVSIQFWEFLKNYLYSLGSLFGYIELTYYHLPYIRFNKHYTHENTIISYL